jgi:hypothetical protein
MTKEEALAAWDTLDVEEEAVSNNYGINFASLKAPPKHYVPFVNAADMFVSEAQNTKRIFTGIPEFDEQMRGIGPGHLGVIVGYAHSGKTLLLMHILRHNRLAKIALFSPDEPATLILTKLACLVHGIPARELEERVAQDDQEAINLLRDTALEHFPNLIVFDKTLTNNVLNDGYKEACDVWGSEADLTVVDYVDLVQGADMVPQKFDILKSFVHNTEAPMWAIHQTSRSAGGEGKAMTISSGNYGGEQHATFMIGVRRKKSAIMAELGEQRVKVQRTGSEGAAERVSELEHDLAIAEYTVTANLVKNKRPGGQLVDELDFEMALSTGRIFQMEGGDLPRQYLANLQRNHQPVPQRVVEADYTEVEMDF